jgi:transcriptional regulator of arginine metabolism
MTTDGTTSDARAGVTRAVRQRAIREIVARHPIGSQADLVDELAARRIAATQATVSRDIAELGLVKVLRGGRHVWVAPEDVAPSRPAGDDSRLRRILGDIPVTVGRSGLILILTGTPGTASVIAQAIDDSTLHEQEGTLAGDNTLIVLFADEPRLERWLARFREVQGLAEGVGTRSGAPSSGASSIGTEGGR